MAAPDSWVGCLAQVNLQLKSLYVMSSAKEFGPIFEVRDVMLDVRAQVCPFVSDF
jgi:hypothetical protein